LRIIICFAFITYLIECETIENRVYTGYPLPREKSGRTILLKNKKTIAALPLAMNG